ncbi:acetolactate synthase small subunit [Thorsellia anophelis]|uniref:acetolactate synthase n=1 Tax=Thorsellia anophelis DSM 18579 TaxID=1123402 RepID=A0A1H9Y421_9GAMM|nr:acetolactate synthase small subunit [Thorsellia anophelis]SES63615.1 acetolactate synthase, small subunit [Thorsellia anophelis DSM 18579]
MTNSALIESKQSQTQYAILALTVRNHPGVMSHICGLFARRAFNMEGILCLPIQGSNSSSSRIWLKVTQDSRLKQIIAQLKKLQDVADVIQYPGNHPIFHRVAPYFNEQI